MDLTVIGLIQLRVGMRRKHSVEKQYKIRLHISHGTVNDAVKHNRNSNEIDFAIRNDFFSKPEVEIK